MSFGPDNVIVAWMTEARRPVSEYADALGYVGNRRRGYACPACKETSRGRGDKRGPVGTGRGDTGWKCYLCAAHGSGLDFAAYHLFGRRVNETDSQQRREVRSWCAARGWCSPPGTRSDAPVVVSPPPTPKPPAPLVRPPAGEVAGYWAAGWALDAPTRDEWGVPAYTFLARRGYTPLIRVIARNDLARWAPPAEQVRPPSWWGWRWPETYRLIVRAWEADGTLGSLHARAIVDLPKDGERSPPKTVWPRHPMRKDGMSYDAAELLFACPLGLRLLRGEPLPNLAAVMVCEGLTDWLSAAALFQNCMEDMARSPEDSDDYPRIVVFGAAAGGFQALRKVKWPEGDYEVWCGTDLDLAGTRYALQVAEAVAPRPIKRGEQVRLLLQRLAIGNSGRSVNG